MIGKKTKKLLLGASLLLCAFLYFALDALFRPLWFDEALTILEFVGRPQFSDIYKYYEIPNNHIVFNFLLKAWMSAYELLFNITDFSFRGFSFFTALLAVFYIFLRWRKTTGLEVSFLIVLAFICSLPFEIYCTAVRGYILSFLLIALSFDLCRLWQKKRKPVYALLFFCASLLAVGAMPSNLIALCGILIYFFPFADIKKAFRAPYIVSALTPAAALIIFYAPIYAKFIKIFSLKEGWNSHSMAAISVYGAFIVSFLPLLIPAFAGGLRFFRKRRFFRIVPALMIIALPLPFIFMKTPAPFPRIFFPLWSLWLIICAICLKEFLKPFRRGKFHIFIAALAVCVLGWAGAQRVMSGSFSALLSERGALDDYFRPYYCMDFNPGAVAREISSIIKDRPMPVFVSFPADHYSIVFYGKLLGLPEGLWRYDNPRGKVISLGNGEALAVIHDESELESIGERFGAKKAALVKSFGYNKLYMLYME